MSRRQRVLISAGEASGDRLGAGLAEALLRRRPDLELVGMGGARMERAGVELVQDSEEVAVVGIVEVLSHLPAIRKAMERLRRSIVESPPDLVVPIDFPDFNLRLAAAARRAGVGVVYFVSPQIWAWRRGRLRKIRELVRRMLVLFPFETEFYEFSDVPVTFVGHPVADRTTEQSAEDLRLLVGAEAGRRVVALMPGSRAGEIRRHLPPMLDAARRLADRDPQLQFLITAAPGADRVGIERAAADSGLESIVIHQGDFPEILKICEAGVVASGTASLEAAVTGLPIVVIYRVNPISYAIGRMLVRLQDVALPNLVAGSRVVPELIQGECNGERIAAELSEYLDDPEKAGRIREQLGKIKGQLGGPGVFERAADALIAELDAEPEAEPK